MSATRQESGAPFRDRRAVRGLIFGMETPLVLIIGAKNQVDGFNGEIDGDEQVVEQLIGWDGELIERCSGFELLAKLDQRLGKIGIAK
jgi:hypothetical protein